MRLEIEAIFNGSYWNFRNVKVHEWRLNVVSYTCNFSIRDYPVAKIQRNSMYKKQKKGWGDYILYTGDSARMNDFIANKIQISEATPFKHLNRKCNLCTGDVNRALVQHAWGPMFNIHYYINHVWWRTF